MVQVFVDPEQDPRWGCIEHFGARASVLLEMDRRNRAAAEGIHTKNGYHLMLTETTGVPYGERGSLTSIGSQTASRLRALARDAGSHDELDFVSAGTGVIPGPWVDTAIKSAREGNLTICRDKNLSSSLRGRNADGRFARAPMCGGLANIAEQRQRWADWFGQDLISGSGIGVKMVHTYMTGANNDLSVAVSPDVMTIQGINYQTLLNSANAIEEFPESCTGIRRVKFDHDPFAYTGSELSGQLKTAVTLITRHDKSKIVYNPKVQDLRTGRIKLFKSSDPRQSVADQLNEEVWDKVTPMANANGEGRITVQYYATPFCPDRMQGTPAIDEVHARMLSPEEQYWNAWATCLNWLSKYEGLVDVEDIKIYKTQDKYWEYVPNVTPYGESTWQCWHFEIRLKNVHESLRCKQELPLICFPGYMGERIDARRQWNRYAEEGATNPDGFGVAIVPVFDLVESGHSIIDLERDKDIRILNMMIRHPERRFLDDLPSAQLVRGPLFGHNDPYASRYYCLMMFIDEDVASGRKPATEVIEVPSAIDSEICVGVDPATGARIYRVGDKIRFRRNQYGDFQLNLDDYLSGRREIVRELREQGKKAKKGFFNQGGLNFSSENSVFAAELDLNLPGCIQDVAVIASVLNRMRGQHYVDGYFEFSWGEEPFLIMRGEEGEPSAGFRFRVDLRTCRNRESDANPSENSGLQDAKVSSVVDAKENTPRFIPSNEFEEIVLRIGNHGNDPRILLGISQNASLREAEAARDHIIQILEGNKSMMGSFYSSALQIVEDAFQQLRNP